MKILQPAGRSFTTAREAEGEADERWLGRGVLVNKPSGANLKIYDADDPIVYPEDLPRWSLSDPKLLIRQSASIFNKTIKTKSRLIHLCTEAYRDRVLLAASVWNILLPNLSRRFEESERKSAEIEALKTLWLGLIHPYASYPIAENSIGLSKDKNAEIIRDHSDKDVSRSDFNGRWHMTFWVLGLDGLPDYGAIASQILSHLVKKEMRINGKPRLSKHRMNGDERGESGIGLAGARAQSIATSVDDPREKRRLEFSEIPNDIVQYYFYEDIAKKIFDKIQNSPKDLSSLSPSDFGSALYEHFGSNPKREEFKKFDKDKKEVVWDLHNLVRDFYANLAESERFRRAFANRNASAETGHGAEWIKLQALVPKDKDALLAAIGAKDRNAEFSRLTRLGKLLAHACDVRAEGADTAAFQEKFLSRLDYLATSDGQSEIKRNEGFARVWRNAVGLSVRSMGAWANANRLAEKETKPGKDFDLTLTGNSQKLISAMDPNDYREGVKQLFGAKAIPHLEGVSRADAVTPAGREEMQEILWGFLRLCAEVRNGTNHFNTRRRLVDLVRGGIIKATEGKAKDNPIGGRLGFEVSEVAQAAFAELLSFDQRLEGVTLLDELNRIKAKGYIPTDQLPRFLAELDTPAEREISVPKFMAVLSKACNLADQSIDNVPERVRPFGVLDLQGLSRQTTGINHFRVGALRLLYGRGFVSWLQSHHDDAGFLSETLNVLLASKEKRKAEYDRDSGRFFATPLRISEAVDPATTTSLSELLRSLTVEAMSDDSLARRSRAASRNRYEKRLLIADQRRRSGSVEEFRRELFACLFGEYLHRSGLSWILGEDHGLRADQDVELLTIGDVPIRQWEVESWHSQFYAWLYLIPLDDISLLRNQFRRHAVLNTKDQDAPDTEEIAVLNDLDRLMGLYISVQAAGFGGLEHSDWLSRSKEGKPENTFYEDDSQFEKVFSEAADTHEMSIPGTRRGLRQIIRFRELGALQAIFKKHRVTNDEVDTFITGAGNKSLQLAIDDREDLRAKIEAIHDQKDKRHLLKDLCEGYKTCAADITRHNFEVNGARLTDFSRVYQLMMRIIGRLNDFTLTWERDRLFVYLGMLYETLGADAFQLVQLRARIGREKRTWVGIRLKDFEPSPEPLAFEKLGEKEMVEELVGKHHFLPVWDDRVGVLLNGYPAEVALLEATQQQLFNRYFGVLEAENPKDVVARSKNKAAKGQKNQTPFRWNCPRAWIRNGFAHYNVIGSRTKVIKLSYHIDAVRSLFGYDRKTKNAVSRAITDILLEEGLAISWTLERDRLRNAQVLPMVRTELGFVGRVDGEDLSFDLPQVSVRFASMVQALFGFESGGHRKLVVRGGESKSRGALTYPEEFMKRHGSRIPPAAIIKYPEI